MIGVGVGVGGFSRIWKYTLAHPLQTIRLPGEGTILSVANQDGNLCLWVMITSLKKEPIPRIIEVIGTGHEIEPIPGVERKFLGTVLADPLVWHIFERIQIQPV